MTTIPQDIKERFYKTIKGDISLDNFEQWLYADKELEKYLNSTDYLDLISLSFQQSGAKNELWNLLKKHIDLGEFETYKMLELLNEAKQKTERLPHILMKFYDLYCKAKLGWKPSTLVERTISTDAGEIPCQQVASTNQESQCLYT